MTAPSPGTPSTTWTATRAPHDTCAAMWAGLPAPCTVGRGTSCEQWWEQGKPRRHAFSSSAFVFPSFPSHLSPHQEGRYREPSDPGQFCIGLQGLAPAWGAHQDRAPPLRTPVRQHASAQPLLFPSGAQLRPPPSQGEPGQWYQPQPLPKSVGNVTLGHLILF